MVHTDLYRNPVNPIKSVDIARKPNDPSSLVITKSGSIRLSQTAMAALHFAAVVLWKYVGDDGCNIIEADEWEDLDGPVINITPPRPEVGAWFFYLNVPQAYRVGLIPGDYSSRIEMSICDGRGVITVPNAIDKKRLHVVDR